MKYSFDYQYLPKGHTRPIDNGVVVDGKADDKGFAIIPAVGDYVDILPMESNAGKATFRGRVRSRLFSHLGLDHCCVNIVVEEVDDAIWGELIKD